MTEYRPAPSVTADRGAVSVGPVTSTVTPGMTLELSSITTPEILAPVCALAIVAAHRTSVIARRTTNWICRM